MKLKSILVFSLTLLWLVFIILNLLAVAKEVAPREDFERKISLADIFLELSHFSWGESAKLSGLLQNQLSREGLNYLQELSLEYPQQSRLSLYLGIIYAALAEPQKAKLELEKAQKDHQQLALAGLLKEIFLEKPLSIKSPKAEALLKENFSGFFLYTSLKSLYLKTGETEKLQNLSRSFQKKAGRKIFILVITGFWLGGGFLLGLGVWVVYLFFFSRFKEEWQRPNWESQSAWGIFLFAFGLKVIIGSLLSPEAQSPSIAGILYNYLLSALLYLVLIFYFIKAVSRLSLTSLGFRFNNAGKKLLLGFSGYFAAIPTVFLLALLSQKLLKLPSFSSNPMIKFVLSAQPNWEVLALLILVGFAGPLFEEIVFRGFLYSTFRNFLGKGWAMIATALIFSLLHLDPAGLIPIFGLGLLLNFLYESSGSILPCFITHCLWNLTTFFLLKEFLG